MLKIIRYDRRRQMKLRSNTHGCELIKNCLYLELPFNIKIAAI